MNRLFIIKKYGGCVGTEGEDYWLDSTWPNEEDLWLEACEWAYSFGNEENEDSCTGWDEEEPECWVDKEVTTKEELKDFCENWMLDYEDMLAEFQDDWGVVLK